MSRKSRTQSLREAKDKRMKRVAIGGAVVLVAVLAFEVPKVLHHGGGSSAAPAATTATSTDATTTTPATAPGYTPAATAAAAATPTASTKLPNSDIAPRRTKSQLFAFSHFAGKDPFVQQVSATSGTGTSPDSGSAPSSTSITTSSTSGNGGSSAGSAPQLTASRTLAGATSATISVNGKAQTVRIGGSFPSSNPLFKLVSISHGVVKIGIAGGSYASGAQTVSLVAGRPLTLADTADGVHYQLRLISAS